MHLESMAEKECPLHLVQQVGIFGLAHILANQSWDKRAANVAIQAVALGTTLFFALPNSREHEREADKMGIETSR